MAASALRDSDDFRLHHFSEAQSVADSADVQLSSEVKSRLPSAVSAHAAASHPEQPQSHQDRGSSASPDPTPLEQDEQSRCTTPQQPGHQGLVCGVEALIHAAWEVPFPNSSVMGLSPRACACAADSSHSDGSNTNLRDFGVNGADSPPWSPRRVPPAHVWGCGPPRTPGYRSGGACCPLASPGVSAANLVEAACELQALLHRRAAFGLGPLLHAQPFFPVAATAAAALEPLACPAQRATLPHEEPLLPRSPSAGSKETVSATPPAQCIGHLRAAAAQMGKEDPIGNKRQAAWRCVGDSEEPCDEQDEAHTADEVSSPHALSSTPELVVHPQQRWASAPPVQDTAHGLQLFVSDESSSDGPHAASAPPEARPARVGRAAAARLGRAPSTPEIMGVSPVNSERILPPKAAGQSQEHAFGAAGAATEQGRMRRRTKRRLF